jgi:hypothetical protein
MPARNLGYFETTVDFDARVIRLSEDCVGARVHFAFRNDHYVICFPNFDFNNLDAFEHPRPTAEGTKIRLNWIKDKLQGDNYGTEYSHNPVDKKVLKFSASRLVIQSRGPVNRAQARKAKNDLPVWSELFVSWLEALQYTDLSNSGIRVTQENDLQAYFIPLSDKRTNRRIKKRKQPASNIAVTLFDGFAKSDLQKALHIASKSIFSPGYYQQIISALRYFNSDNYRQCLLDTATAFEMAMIDLLDDRLKGITVAQKALIGDKYQQIIGLSDALRKLGVSVPTQHDIQTKVAEPRNAAVHRGVIVTRDEANIALVFVKDFIYSSLPITRTR